MFSFLQYEFVQYALIITILIGLSGAILSPFLVLNEQALIADGLAHVSFAGLALGMLFINEPLFISIPFVIIFAVLIKYLSIHKNLNSDAALGLISSIALAIGLIIVHKGEGFNRSIESMLVGNLWTVSRLEIFITAGILVLITSFVGFFYNDLVLMTYDFKFAKFKKVNTNFLSYTTSILTAVLITVGVKTIGTLLISSFIIFPVIIGMQFGKGFKHTLIFGAIASVISVITGVFLAHFIDLPAGSTIVLVYAIILVIIFIANRFIKGDNYRD